MSIYRSKERGAFVFEFSRRINGQRIRAQKILPKAWNQAQADAFDRKESAQLYAAAQRVGGAECSIEDAVASYLNERVPQLKAGANTARELGQMYWAYQGRPLSALADVCKAYSLKAKKENGTALAPATIMNRIRYLTAACRYGWKHHAMCEHDPAARVTVPTVRNARQGFISRAEMLRLARACKHQPTRAMIRIAFYSGMRRREILRAEVVGTAFVLRDTKNGDARIVPIHPKLRTCLDFERPTEFALNYHFCKARASVKMDWLHFHDLRHSAASAMINEGVDLHTVGAVLGHRSSASTKRYAHLATENLRGAIRMIGRKAA